MIQQMFAIWSLVTLHFLSILNSWKFMIHILLKPGLENFDISLLACEMSSIMWSFEHSLALPFFGIGMKIDYFLSCGHCWVFPNNWHIEWSTLIASPFRIWYISSGILSPTLALFVVTFPKAYLISYSKIPVSSWVITQLWLSGSLRSFFFFIYI